MGYKPPKGSKSRDSSPSESYYASPMKTWLFAILPPIEVLAKMAYGSGMKNQG